jgi:putative membrane protein
VNTRTSQHKQGRLGLGLFLFGYFILFAVCAIDPYDRAVWWAENIPILILVFLIAVTSKYHQFSTLSIFFMSFLVVFHTIGGHFTFERVPFSFVTESFGFERNHYDRIAHFSVGFFALPIAELLLDKRLVSSRVILFLFPVFTVFTVAGVYELFEWQYAIAADPSAGIAVLGSQGDIWDAQKDILADGLGAIFAVTVFFVLRKSELADLKSWRS